MCASQLRELENGSLQTTPAMLTGPSAVAAVHAVRLTVAALAAHIGAKLQRAVAWVRRHELELHRP